MAHKRNIFYENAYEYYKSGKSLSQVAEIIGVTRQCVYDAFKSRGYILREKKYRDYQIYDNIKFTLRNSGYYSSSTGNRYLMHRYVWTIEKGNIPEGYDIHHKNCDRSDNRIQNLECLPKSEHTRLYSPHNNQYTKGRKKHDTHRTI